jgi:tetratricopeptide (TPR) repeat protein
MRSSYWGIVRLAYTRVREELIPTNKDRKKREKQKSGQKDQLSHYLGNMTKTGSDVKSEPWSNKGVFVTIALLLIVTFFAYLPVFDAPFVFDDFPAIVRNVGLRNLSNIEGIWLLNHKRFLSNLTFAINYKFGQNDAFGYHVVNFLFHFGSTLGVFVLAKILSKNYIHGKKTIPVLAALIFALHPVQTQAVSYIVQRTAVLSSLFYIWGLSMYACFMHSGIQNWRKRIIYYLISVICLISATLSKEIAFSFPLSIAAIELFSRGFSLKQIRNWIWVGSYFLITLGCYLVVHLGTPPLDKLIFELENLPIATYGNDLTRFEYFITQLSVVRTYVRLAILPVSQNLDYDYPFFRSIFSLVPLFSLLFSLALVFFAFISRKKYPLMGLGIFLFYIGLSIESSIFPIEDVIFEHRMYLPLAGFSLAIAAIFVQIWELLKNKYKFKSNAWGITFASLVISILAITTFSRNLVWANDERLWIDTISKSPNKARPYAALAMVYEKYGRYRESIDFFQKAKTLDPRNDIVYLNTIGTINLRLGEEAKAMEIYKEVLERKPTDIFARNNLGAIYVNKGDFEKAKNEFAKALETDPDEPTIYKNLGIIASQEGDFDTAIKHFLHAANLEPKNPLAFVYLGNAYRAAAKLDQAKKEYFKALELDPFSFEAMTGLGVCFKYEDINMAREYLTKAIGYGPKAAFEAYYQLGLIELSRASENSVLPGLSQNQDILGNAENLLKKALSINANHSNSYNALGIIYWRRGLPKEAISHFEAALELNPRNQEARNNLNKVKK